MKAHPKTQPVFMGEAIFQLSELLAELQQTGFWSGTKISVTL
jgi:hypothetical protein